MPSTPRVTTSRIAIAITDVDAEVARHLARKLRLPLCELATENQYPLCTGFDFYLHFRHEAQTKRLELCDTSGTLGKSFSIDFSRGTLAHRRQYGGGRGQPLARAVSLKGGMNPVIIDATGGTGRDAFVLASLGAQVTVIERSPVLAALLADALERASAKPELTVIISRIQLVQADAIGWLSQCPASEKPDVVYLDPMYPHRSKSALVKKEMRILRALVGDDNDAGQLLEAALGCARKRVVVKRPKGAPEISGLTGVGKKPACAVQSKNTRYDLYPIT